MQLRPRILAVCALALVPLLSGGCAKGQRKSRVWTQGQAERLLVEALQSEPPDERRPAGERGHEGTQPVNVPWRRVAAVAH